MKFPPKETPDSTTILAYAILILAILVFVIGIVLGNHLNAIPCDNGKVGHFVYPIRVRPIPLWVRTNHGRCSSSVRFVAVNEGRFD